MSIGSFLRDKLAFMMLNLFVAGFSGVLLHMVNTSAYFTLCVPLVYVLGCVVIVTGEFLQKQGYYNRMEKTLNQLEQKCLLTELLERPGFLEGEIFYDTLKTVNKSMNDEIAKHETASKEYREYIELWVHEIKTPIAGAKLFCENAKNEALLLELDKINHFVEQALFYSRSNHVEKDFLIRQVRLKDLVNSTVRKSARRLIAGKIAIQAGELSETVCTDGKWIAFILEQIMDNAIKYGATRIGMDSVNGENSCSLFITDDGIGIKEEDLSRVFDKGFTGGNGRTHAKSTGIGLYLCKKLCVKLGLGLGIDAKEGEGTKMEIIFPKSNMYG